MSRGAVSRSWLVVLAAYLFVFGILLIGSHGLPYAIDNNESFSSLWHARNLATIGLSETKGLADEVFSFAPSASPYVHTHQGNFPRLFAFLLYILGIRTIEGQIVVTTLSVGLLSIWFAHRFLVSITTPLFAGVACVILITDYALFGQWQMNTYRVWYGFFFFSSLFWVHGLNGKRSTTFFLLGTLDFAAMFYGEYVFAAFVGMVAGFYALARNFRQPRALLYAFLAIVSGSLIAAVVLTCQLLAYLGPEALRRDIHYTLSARNMASNHSFAEMVGKFYSAHHVIFWQNYFDTSHLHSLAAVASSFAKYHVAIYGCWLPLITSVLLIGWLVRIVLPDGESNPAKSATSPGRSGLLCFAKLAVIGVALYSFGDVALTQLLWIAPREVLATRTATDKAVITWRTALNASYELDLSTNSDPFASLGSSASGVYGIGDISPSAVYRVRIHSVIDGVTSPWREVSIPLILGIQSTSSEWTLRLMLLFLTACALLVFFERRRNLFLAPTYLSCLQAILAALLLYVAGFLLVSRGLLFGGPIQETWHSLFGPVASHWVGPFSFVAAACYSVGLLLSDQRGTMFGIRSLTPLFPVTLCVVFAYLSVYQVFTGYIYSGYLVRQAPFLVFWSDVLLAVAPVLLLTAFIRNVSAGTAALRAATGTAVDVVRRRQPSVTEIIALAGSIPAGVSFLFCGALVLGFVVTWFCVQGSYLGVVPPTGYSFLRRLSEAPYRGGSLVVNNYPAPMAEKAHSWAYAESAIFSGQVKLGPEGFTVEHDKKYLWFADAATNPKYMEPDFGLLVTQPASLGEALQKAIERSALAASLSDPFSSTGAVERSKDPLQAFLYYRLMDSEPRKFALLRFDWDYPPYLRKVEDGPNSHLAALTMSQRISLNVASRLLGRRWRIEVEPVNSDRTSGASGSLVMMRDASIDGVPIFSGQELSTAGWIQAPLGASGSSLVWKTSPGVEHKLSAVVVGDQPVLEFIKGPNLGSVHLVVNDQDGVIDLLDQSLKLSALRFDSDKPHGKHTSIPNFAPGVYLETVLNKDERGKSQADLLYRYTQQTGKPEAEATARVYGQYLSGGWTLLDSITFIGNSGLAVRADQVRRSNPDLVARYERDHPGDTPRGFEHWLARYLPTDANGLARPGVMLTDPAIIKPDGTIIRRLPLNASSGTQLQISIQPATETKFGPEYFGLPFKASTVAPIQPGESHTVSWASLPPASFADFPYGKLKLRLRFPTDKFPQAEPLVASGINEAGDFVYIIYSDREHIRIGYDHWFQGGELSPPIPVDYAATHEVIISYGALYPSEDDLMFDGFSKRYVEDLKGRVSVSLDGVSIVDSEAESYATTVEEVTVGKNKIKGTTSNPLFTGEILEMSRIWPEGY